MPDVPVGAPPRTPWVAGFPDIVVHTTEALRNSHADYPAAKAADPETADPAAALRLAQDLLEPNAVERLALIAGNREPILLPVTAFEIKGVNTIPDAMAQILAETLNWRVSLGDIVQTNRVGHTRARAFNRIVTPAAFDGVVLADSDYVLVDDHVGIGGTLANLKGHIEMRGGRVIAMTTLTQTRDAMRIALQPDTLDVLRRTHGEALEAFWQAHFGHGLDCFTNVEAGILCRQRSVESIRGLLTQAALEARERGLVAWV
jgi:hypothetical protein